MVRHEQLPDPPVSDLVEQIEKGITWSNNLADKLEDLPKLSDLEKREEEIREELKNCVIELLSEDSGSRYKDLNTTALFNLALRQIHDTGKVINGLYVALQGRDKTRRIGSKE